MELSLTWQSLAARRGATTLRGVSPYLVGRVIREVIVRDKRLRWPVSDTIHELEGCKVTRGSRRAKYLLFETKAGTLLIHLGMSGALRITEPDTPFRKHDHVAITIEGGKQLRLHDPRRFGCVLLINDPSTHPLLTELGPEPLNDEFDADCLRSQTKGRSAPIKAVIMTLLFTLTSADVAPQIGLGIGAVLTFMAGLVSTLRVSPMPPR